ncbi:MAG: UDP-N-acetylmuramoyl-L-alanyl-D-glutamate--2,6-diaminopimelate ligase [Pseudomonadota bacterium]
MRLGDIFDPLPAGAQDIKVSGLTADSRKVAPGFVFAALKGVAADGRDYIQQAIERGAVAVLGHDLPSDMTVPGIDAVEPRLALARAAVRFYPRQPETIVAITGTNGKSSTVDFLRQIWSHCGKKAASMGTLGAIAPSGSIDLGHTTPDPVAIHETLQTLADEGVSHAAMEASSHGLVQFRLDAVRLAAGAFTNLTQDHLDYHPTFDDYRAAKLRLFTELLPEGAPVVINADSDEKTAFESGSKAAGLELVSVGWRGSDLKISELMPRATSQKLYLDWRGQEAEIDLPLIGEFQALNALTAVGLALALGDSFGDVLKGMAALEPVKGRMEFVGETSEGAGIFVDYAHTPDGLDTLLRAARPHTAGRLVLVFGAGGDRDPFKRPLMGEVATRLADEIIVTDDNPRSEEPGLIRKAILDSAGGAAEIGDRGEAIFEGVRKLGKGDTLLIAGKGHETGQIVGDTILPFSDQETALKALEAAA